MTFDVDHVPGHSRGSVSFRVTVQTDDGPREVVLGGDVLFQDGVGRTDLPGGDAEVLMQSIAKKFLRSEEHTSELQSRFDLVCRLLLEKKQLIDCATLLL